MTTMSPCIADSPLTLKQETALTYTKVQSVWCWSYNRHAWYTVIRLDKHINLMDYTSGKIHLYTKYSTVLVGVPRRVRSQ